MRVLSATLVAVLSGCDKGHGTEKAVEELPSVSKLPTVEKLAPPVWTMRLERASPSKPTLVTDAGKQVALDFGDAEAAAASSGRMAEAARPPVYWTSEGATRIGLAVAADGEVSWQAIRNVVGLCFERRVHRIGLAVMTGAGKAAKRRFVELSLPWRRTRGELAERRHDVVLVKVGRATEAGLHEVTVNGVAKGVFDLRTEAGIAKLVAALPTARETLELQLSAPASPSYATVMRLWDGLSGAGVEQVYFDEWTPWPPQPEQVEIEVTEER